MARREVLGVANYPVHKAIGDLFSLAGSKVSEKAKSSVSAKWSSTKIAEKITKIQESAAKSKDGKVDCGCECGKRFKPTPTRMVYSAACAQRLLG